MRALPLASFCLASLLGFAVAFDSRAEDTNTTPGLIVFKDRKESAENGLPKVLRGSAVRRGVATSDVDGPEGLQIGAGDKLWFADPTTGEVIVCDERRTNRVGHRFIGCVEDRLPFTTNN